MNRIVCALLAASVASAICADVFKDRIMDVSERFAATRNPAAIIPECRELAATRTNATDRLLCENLRAAAQFAVAENELDDKLLSDTYSLCTNNAAIAKSLNSPFCKALSSYNMAVLMANDGKFDSAYAISTNALGDISGFAADAFEKRLWENISLHGADVSLDIEQTFRTYAAICLLLAKDSADISTFTNGLPPKAISLIDEFAKK